MKITMNESFEALYLKKFETIVNFFFALQIKYNFERDIAAIPRNNNELELGGERRMIIKGWDGKEGGWRERERMRK